MKKKLKDLTSREGQMICKKREHQCLGCQLSFACFCTLKAMTKTMLEKEIEVEDEKEN